MWCRFELLILIVEWMFLICDCLVTKKCQISEEKQLLCHCIEINILKKINNNVGKHLLSMSGKVYGRLLTEIDGARSIQERKRLCGPDILNFKNSRNTQGRMQPLQIQRTIIGLIWKLYGAFLKIVMWEGSYQKDLSNFIGRHVKVEGETDENFAIGVGVRLECNMSPW